MAAGHESAPDYFHHVRDFPFFELPLGIGANLAEWFKGDPHVHVDAHATGIPLPNLFGFQITKFMVLQVVAGLLTLLIFKGLAKRIASGEPTRGRFWNFWESIALFIRDEVVRPTIGDGHHGHDDDHGGAGHSVSGSGEVAVSGHYADQFLPIIWSCFFYILMCNLLGAIPMLGSPTGSLGVTLVLAVTVFGYNIIQGTKQFGFIGFWKNQVPDIGLEGPMGFVITKVLWCIEVVGLFIKHGVLAVRLFANIMGGHTVVGVILGFCAAEGVAGNLMMQFMVVPASVFGQIAIGLLELFVAFLQAYVFAFLATIFLSAAIHEH
jgi:F-type H+-transporting ATPase subunit a